MRAVVFFFHLLLLLQLCSCRLHSPVCSPLELFSFKPCSRHSRDAGSRRRNFDDAFHKPRRVEFVLVQPKMNGFLEGALVYNVRPLPRAFLSASARTTQNICSCSRFTFSQQSFGTQDGKKKKERKDSFFSFVFLSFPSPSLLFPFSLSLLLSLTHPSARPLFPSLDFS